MTRGVKVVDVDGLGPFGSSIKTRQEHQHMHQHQRHLIQETNEFTPTAFTPNITWLKPDFEINTPFWDDVEYFVSCPAHAGSKYNVKPIFQANANDTKLSQRHWILKIYFVR